jgi:predicted dehydrogenase
MRQILQSLRDGRTALVEVPAPVAGRGALLIRSSCSLISAGTERMLLEFGRAGWLDKARQQPQRVRQVLDKLGSDGLLPTLEAVRGKLEQPLALGYCNVGAVVEVGTDVEDYRPGERVVSNGAHAEWVAVPRNLCARIPAEVADEEAAFTVLGAIALQGLRLAAPTLGENIAVTGLGLIGLLTVQLLRANGCRVLGIDPDPARRELARQFGAQVVASEDSAAVLAAAQAFSQGQGMDAVLVTAATSSSEPVSQAAQMCRKRARVVLVGVAGLELDRAQFYQKELVFQVSCSYGPGRYDPHYEQQGVDYPIGFVRWTEQRNFQAVLELLASRRLDVRPLISHRFAFTDAAAAYELLAPGAEPSLGILLEYPAERSADPAPTTVTLATTPAAPRSAGRPRIAVIGAGNYAGRVLIPALAESGAELVGIASAGGVTAAHCGRKFGFGRATTDAAALIGAADVDAVVIATRHDTHALLAAAALRAGKHVFVEKPLALSSAQIDEVAAAWQEARAQGRSTALLVGFNRRFAPQVLTMKSLLAQRSEPMSIIATINAGRIPADHWTQDPHVGGGRIVGEACHFVDLLRFLVGRPVVHARLQRLGTPSSATPADSASVLLSFDDGSIGTIHYLANGHRAFPKERVEVFCGGKVLQLDNFRRLRGYGWAGFNSQSLWRQDKGQRALVRAFMDAIRSGAPPPIPFEELIEVSRTVVALGEAAQR